MKNKTRVFEFLFREFSRKNRVFALQVHPVFLSLNAQEGTEKTHVLLTPLNYFEWEVKMVIHPRLKGLYIFTMGTDMKPNFAVEKSKYFNRSDEALRMLCLSISMDILFHVDIIKTPNEVCLNLDSLFGKENEMRGHQLRNESISLSPTHFETIQDFFTKFK